VVCGSSASWILENLIHNKGGFYNRITYQLELDAFTLKESQQFLTNKNIKLTNEQILKLYMAMGGIPLYLDHVAKGLSADQNIDEICFSKRGLLFREFDQLFASLFNHHEIIEELVRIIASHRYGISQVDLMAKSSKAVGGRLKKRLKELENAGFVEAFMPYHHKGKGIYYRIIDEYTLFYLKWIEPIINTLTKRDISSGYWQAKNKSASWLSWAGYAYESICYKHIAQIRKALGIEPGAEIASWRYTPRKGLEDMGAQIDLLFDRDDNVITICEIKYTNSPFAIDKKYAQDLLRKVDVFRKQSRTNKQIFITMISASGLKPTMYSEELITGVVKLDDLFRL
ncbi:MAG: AAA family ATPase, partial [Gammaproteobacteria bacterium]|nr:AAA family ATPase [Gammaproteobacteria bacterium]